MAEPKVVHVEIQGQRYPIRTTLDPKYVQDLAAYVDRKMGLAAEASPASDTLGMAVLTALNIADEFFRIRDQQLDDADVLTARAAALERIVDQALELVGNPEKPS
ncbi:MAG TPA: cell division protein ZapA [Vicinamibacterales bacterium]|nr:cell division protein ZapA [Vicinamibacterales bacterium]